MLSISWVSSHSTFDSLHISPIRAGFLLQGQRDWEYPFQPLREYYSHLLNYLPCTLQHKLIVDGEEEVGANSPERCIYLRHPYLHHIGSGALYPVGLDLARTRPRAYRYGG
jgi:hypothetical protein